jgi:hypothetical protein
MRATQAPVSAPAATHTQQQEKKQEQAAQKDESETDDEDPNALFLSRVSSVKMISDGTTPIKQSQPPTTPALNATQAAKLSSLAKTVVSATASPAPKPPATKPAVNPPATPEKAVEHKDAPPPRTKAGEMAVKRQMQKLASTDDKGAAGPAQTQPRK